MSTEPMTACSAAAEWGVFLPSSSSITSPVLYDQNVDISADLVAQLRLYGVGAEGLDGVGLNYLVFLDLDAVLLANTDVKTALKKVYAAIDDYLG